MIWLLFLLVLGSSTYAMENELAKSSSMIPRPEGAPTPPAIEESEPVPGALFDPIVVHKEQTMALLFHDLHDSVMNMSESPHNTERREYYSWRYLQLSQHPLAGIVLEMIKHEMERPLYPNWAQFFRSMHPPKPE